MTEFTAYGVPGSPFLRAALLGLEETRAPYRLHALAPGESKSAEHLARHPFGRVPVVDHGDFRLYETQAILRYLAALYPQAGLIPGEVRARARMDQLIGISDWYVFPQVTVAISAERLFSQMFWNRPTDEAKVAESAPAARNCIQVIDRLKGSAPYLTGESASVADLMLAPQLAYFATTPEGAMLEETSLADWLRRMSARPSWGATEVNRLMEAA